MEPRRGGWAVLEVRQPCPQGLLALQHWRPRRPWGRSWSCPKEKSSGVEKLRTWRMISQVKHRGNRRFYIIIMATILKNPPSWIISQHYRVICRGKNVYSQGGTRDFKWPGWSNGAKSQDPTKFLGLPAKPQKIPGPKINPPKIPCLFKAKGNSSDGNVSVNSTCAQPPPPRATEGHWPALSVLGVRHLQILHCPGTGHLPTTGLFPSFCTHVVSYQKITTQVLLQKKADWLVCQGQE